MKPINFKGKDEFIFIKTESLLEYEDLLSRYKNVIPKKSQSFTAANLKHPNNLCIWLDRYMKRMGNGPYATMVEGWKGKAIFMTYTEFMQEYDDRVSLDAIISDLDEKILLMEQRMNHG